VAPCCLRVSVRVGVLMDVTVEAVRAAREDEAALERLAGMPREQYVKRVAAPTVWNILPLVTFGLAVCGAALTFPTVFADDKPVAGWDTPFRLGVALVLLSMVSVLTFIFLDARVEAWFQRKALRRADVARAHAVFEVHHLLQEAKWVEERLTHAAGLLQGSAEIGERSGV